MKRTMVRYRVKPERIEDNEALVRAVYAELAKQKLEGVRYMTLKDGANFVHIAFSEVDPNPIVSLPVFKEFTAKIGERCEEPPVTSQLTVIGSHNF
jgi:hypothetical protein